METWSHWVSIATNIAVVAGLILLAVEIDQNSEMLRITSARESTASIIEIQAHQMDSDVAKVLLKAYDDEPLSNLEVVIVEGYLNPQLLVLQDDYADYLRGLYAEPRWQSRSAFVRALLQPQATRDWWITFKSTFSSEFQQYIDAEIANLPAPVKYSDLLEGTPIPSN